MPPFVKILVTFAGAMLFGGLAFGQNSLYLGIREEAFPDHDHKLNIRDIEKKGFVVDVVLAPRSISGSTKELNEFFMTEVANLAPKTYDVVVLATHGTTVSGKSGYSTWLQGFGEIGESGVNDELRRVLGPLRGRLRTGGIIVFEACSTMCGSRESLERRAQSLRSFLETDAFTIVGTDKPSISRTAMGRLRQPESLPMIGAGVAGLSMLSYGIMSYFGIPSAELLALPAGIAATLGQMKAMHFVVKSMTTGVSIVLRDAEAEVVREERLRNVPEYFPGPEAKASAPACRALFAR